MTTLRSPTSVAFPFFQEACTTLAEQEGDINPSILVAGLEVKSIRLMK